MHRRQSADAEVMARIMKSHRLTVATGVLSCAALVLAACGGSSGSGVSASGVIHLTIWQQRGGGHGEAAPDSAIKDYEPLRPNIQITETPVTNDAKILSAISGGNPPDIIDPLTTLDLLSWATVGPLTPLNLH